MPERHNGSQDGRSHYVGKNSVATISYAIAFGTRVTSFFQFHIPKRRVGT